MSDERADSRVGGIQTRGLEAGWHVDKNTGILSSRTGELAGRQPYR